MAKETKIKKLISTQIIKLVFWIRDVTILNKLWFRLWIRLYLVTFNTNLCPYCTCFAGSQDEITIMKSSILITKWSWVPSRLVRSIILFAKFQWQKKFVLCLKFKTYVTFQWLWLVSNWISRLLTKEAMGGSFLIYSLFKVAVFDARSDTHFIKILRAGRMKWRWGR